MTPTFTVAAELFGSWFTDVERGEPPARFNTTTNPFTGLDMRPGQAVLGSADPRGAGKPPRLFANGNRPSSKLNESAKLLVANVEMSPTLLVEPLCIAIIGRAAHRHCRPDIDARPARPDACDRGDARTRGKPASIPARPVQH